MAKSFNRLRASMAPARRKRNQLRTEMALFAMSLAEIRQHRQQTHPSIKTNPLVDLSGHGQTEPPQDMRLSTLVNFIAEMGGTLKLIAQFPDEEIVINQFDLETAPR